MHRSGTSALTRVISRLGADLPSNLMPPVKDINEAGFWESMEIYRLNDDILASGGSRWDDWRRFNADWIRSTAKLPFKARALAILEHDFAKSSIFVLKDPRNCRLLPFWLEVLQEFEAEPKCLVPIRNPLEVAASLRRRDGFSQAKSQMLWLRHVLDAELGTRGLKRAFVRYASMLEDWRGAVGALSQELQIAWPRRSATAEYEIDQFLEHRHRHHTVGDEKVADHPEISAWVKEAYSALLELQAHPESVNALGCLDTVFMEFNRASDSLGAVVLAAELEREEMVAASLARANDLQNIAAHGKTRIAELEQAVGVGKTRIAELEQAVGVGKTRIAELKQAALTSEARLVELSSELECEKKKNSEILALEHQLLHRLNGIQVSASWQLTDPLRVMEGRWPRLVRGIAAIPKLMWWAVTLCLRQRLRLRRQANHLLATKLFDLSWYVEHNPDIVLGGHNPLLHWLVAGWREGRDPNPLFDCRWYLAQNPDVARAGLNPLEHYLASGAREGRDPSPLFDSRRYLARHPEVAEAGTSPLAHYLASGAGEPHGPSTEPDTQGHLSKLANK